MNFIKRLQQELARAEALAEEYRKRDQRLVAYLSSRKFQCGDALDGYVNVADVIHVLREGVEVPS